MRQKISNLTLDKYELHKFQIEENLINKVKTTVKLEINSIIQVHLEVLQ